jgi:hypothetical protein
MPQPKPDRHVDPIGTDAMFDVEPLRHAKQRTKSVPSAAQGNCPRCLRGKTGLMPQGRHLVWRQHNYTTWSGARMPCPASGIAVCALPEVNPLDGLFTVRCMHDD